MEVLMKLKKDYIKFLMNGKTNEYMAEAMGISRNWFNTIIKRGYANMNMVNKIAKALDVDPKEIVKLED
ncbi:hypothetical protein HMPREF3200_01012 [Anaerococcus tetradius]|uniref:HTH cro/C1-type domain-containing protein n=2 Tax=Anaerococcus tetradius TaxID=33036 RepID=A0A133KEE2_9FIRM|nr:hypothetical protein HMPREF3200_01012 [Anaerococcus tetradius]